MRVTTSSCTSAPTRSAATCALRPQAPRGGSAPGRGGLGGAGVRFRRLTAVAAGEGRTVRLGDAVTGEPSEAQAELVVVKTRLAVEDELLRELDGAVPALVAIGDCAAPRRMSHAVLEANVALRRFHAGELASVATALSV